LWSDVIAKYPTRAAVAYKNRGNYYGQNKKLDEAMRDYEVFLQIDKTDPEIYLNVGNVYNLIGQRDNKVPEYARKAISAYTQVVLKGEDKFSAYLNRANTYGSLGLFDSAYADYESASRLKPDDLKLRFNLATTLSRAGRYTEAIEEFNAVSSAYNQDFNFFMERGRTYFMSQRYTEAQPDFERALQLDPKSPDATFNLSVNAYRMNDFNRALDFARKARALGHPVDQDYMQELEAKAGQ
jgi:tetratricopeptide (TPR) repeat protein